VQTHTAILLRKIRLTESSLIVSWITGEGGRIKTVAKGALRPKGRLAGLLDLFHLCEIQVQPARTGDLHSLREVTLRESFSGMRTDFARIALGSYAVELLEKATEPETPMPELFDLFARLLRHLHAHAASRRALLHFESELARLLGITSPDHTAEDSLLRHLHRMPAARADLLARLPLRPA
jgi:DNA repair protein RecO (recombination protein O)